MTEGRPQVVAHRGSSATYAEHTLGAYLAAIEEGADAFECDVRLTADGHLVCLHDRDLARVAPNDRRRVSAVDLAELEQLDVASWKRPVADPALGNVLTLRRLLETAATAPRRIELAIETKHPTRYGGLVERRLIELLDEFGWAGAGSPVRVMSFSAASLRRVRRLAPQLRLVFLMDRRRDWARVRPFADPAWIAGPGLRLLREHPAMIERIRDSGVELHVWTVNEPADIDLCLRMGVAAIITDKPGPTLAHLRG